MTQPASGTRTIETGQSLTLVLVAVTLVQALATLTLLSIAAIAPRVAEGLAVGPELVGVQVSAMFVMAAICSGLAGSWTRRYGAVFMSQATLVLSGLGAALAIIPTLPTVLLGSLFIGFAYGLPNPAANHLLYRVTPDHRLNLIFSIKQTGVPLGGMAAGLLLPPITETFGWQVGLGTVVLLTALGTVALVPLRRRWDTDMVPNLPMRAAMVDGVRLIWTDRPLRYLSLATFCFSATQLTLVSFIVTMLVVDVNMTLVVAGLIAALVHAAGVTGRVAWGWFADRMGNGLKTLQIIGAVSTIMCLMTGIIGPDTPTALIALILVIFGFAAIGWNGVFMAETARLAPAGAIAAATGGALMITYMGNLLGPSMFAVIYRIVGSYAGSFMVVSIIPVVGIVLFAFARYHAARADSHSPG